MHLTPSTRAAIREGRYFEATTYKILPIPGVDNRVETQGYKLKGHSIWNEIPLKRGFCLRVRVAYLYSERLRLLKEPSVTHWFILV